VDATHITEILTDRVTVDLIERSPLMRIAYTALDGTPRVVPLAYLVRDGRLSFCTIVSSDKVPALQRDPRVAITIDTIQPLCFCSCTAPRRSK
jgi:nitroimidazol reductase NimA-like FMN-containing flavoprotein (pyridoxamine 5'-phosphate oxidase superfamily)